MYAKTRCVDGALMELVCEGFGGGRMGSSAVEFRFRYLIHTVIFVLGFWAPWDRLSGAAAASGSLWLTAAAWAARGGWMSFSGATVLLLVAGIVLAAAGAGLRTWGSAYLGASIVIDGSMHGGRVVAEGPYRSMRNPLYLGTMLHALALALLMPPTGALFAVVAIGVMQVRLILGEEGFLRGKLGAAYEAYCAAVPRVWPTLWARTMAGGARPRWREAALGESYMIGVAVAFAVFGWRYNAFLLMKCALISFGLSLVARAFLPVASGERPALDVGA